MNSRRGFLIWRYATFFLLISFVVTSSFLLFLNSMKIDYSVLAQNALFTFGNIFFLSFFCFFGFVCTAYSRCNANTN